MPKTITSPSGRTLHHVATVKTTKESDTSIKVIKVDRQKLRRDENEEYLKNANVKAFLTMIAKSEGGDYHAKYGNGWKPGNWTFTDESTHPGFGWNRASTAAGRYQILQGSWGEHGTKKQGLTDFSPHTQDLIAVEIIRYRHAIDNVVDGDIKSAIDKLQTNEWVSLPNHSYEVLKTWYTEAGGTVK